MCRKKEKQCADAGILWRVTHEERLESDRLSRTEETTRPDGGGRKMGPEEAFNEYLTARIADGRAPRTIEDYRRVARPFIKWCAKRDIQDVRRLNARDAREYVGMLRTKEWAPGTISIHVRGLRAMWRWWYEEGITTTNLAVAVRHKKVKPKIPDLPPFEEMQKLIEICKEDSFLGARDKAIITMLVDTGMRVGELVSRKLSDVHLEEDSGAVYVTASKTKTTRFVFIEKVATQALKKYLKYRQDKTDIQEEARDILFVTRRGKPMSPNTVQRMVKRRAREAGLDPTKFHPHLFRKVFATIWVENGGDESQLLSLAGWSTMEMLKIYILASRKRQLQRAHRMHSPGDTIFMEDKIEQILNDSRLSDSVIQNLLWQIISGQRDKSVLYSLLFGSDQPRQGDSDEPPGRKLSTGSKVDLSSNVPQK